MDNGDFSFDKRESTSEKKRALIITNDLGFIANLWNDIKLLSDLRYCVHFAANYHSDVSKTLKDKLEENHIPFINIPFDSKNPISKTTISAYRIIRKLLKENRYDLIHCHTAIAGLLTRIAARKYRKKTKVIYTTHGFTFTDLSSKKEWLKYYPLELLASLFTDMIITINYDDFEIAKKCMQKKYGISMGSA